MTFSDVAKRLLEYPNIAVADAPTFSPSPTLAIKDAIFGALGTMFKEAPLIFASKYASRLDAPLTGSCYSGGEIFIWGGTAPALLSTARIAGSNFDVTVIERDATEYSTAPPPDVTGTVPITIFNDSLLIPSTYEAVGQIVTANNVALEKVGSLSQALSKNNAVTATGRRDTGEPAYWWEARHKGATYVCLYPAPSAAAYVSVDVCYGAASVADVDVYTSTETFDIANAHWRDILLPLAVERFQSSPLFANPRASEQIKLNAAEARRALAELRPRAPRRPDFGEYRTGSSEADDYGHRRR